MVTPLAAVRDRLEAAGIPDAAFEAAQLYMLATGRDARLSGGAPLTAFEQKKLDARVKNGVRGSRCNICAANGTFWT